jgi:hypothetical protein
VDEQLHHCMILKATEKSQRFRNITGATESEISVPEISSFLLLEYKYSQVKHVINL